MGNRGRLHNEKQEIVRQFQVQRWITCLLEFKGRSRTVMTPGFYTELFFLDEAVAFAAGHRPCAECRRDRFNAYRTAWGGTPSAPAMDEELHRARVGRDGGKVTYRAKLESLPDGCFVEIEGVAHLVWEDGLFPWTPSGYAAKRSRPDETVTVLTPLPTVQCFKRGYRPEVNGLF